MSFHISAQRGEIAQYVLLCGDPRRVKHIAETYLDDPKLVSEVRGMCFYTGEFLGTKLTVGAHGMGGSSVAIYARELYVEYDVKIIIRLGSCGALLPTQKMMDLVTVKAVCGNNNFDQLMFHKRIPVIQAQSHILQAIEACEHQLGYPSQKGTVFSQDLFYNDDGGKLWQDAVKQHQAVAIDMECYTLFLVANHCGKEAGAVLTVVNLLATPGVKPLSDSEKVSNLSKMILLGLNTVKHLDNLARQN